MSDLKNWDDLLQQIREKRKNEIIINEEQTNEEKKNIQEFDKKFAELFTSLLHWVLVFNNKLAPEKLKLEVVSGIENDTSNRKAVQVVLKKDEKYNNLLDNPYLLIEGYANKGEVRIVKSGSADQGHTVNVNDVNPEALQSELSNFVLQAI